MAAGWIDRLARAAAGTHLSHPQPGSAVGGESTFTRETALKSAAVFGLAAMVPGLHPAVARGADACREKCLAGTGKAAFESFVHCRGGNVADVLFPMLWLTKNISCAALMGTAGIVNSNACSFDTFIRDAGGKCEFDGPNPPRPPKTYENTYPPKPPDRNPRNKKPPRKPGICGNSNLPSGAKCCPSAHGPDIPCYTGCAKDGNGCCRSADKRKCR